MVVKDAFRIVEMIGLFDMTEEFSPEIQLPRQRLKMLASKSAKGKQYCCLRRLENNLLLCEMFCGSKSRTCKPKDH
jgi:hypothetical protein